MAISVVRIKYLDLFHDVTWQNASAACWSIGELASGVTCACLPTLRPLVSGYFPQLDADVDPSDLTYARHSRERKDLEASTNSSASREPGSGGGFDGIALYDKFVPIPERARAAARASAARPLDEDDSGEEIMGLGSARQGLDSMAGDGSEAAATVRTLIAPSRPASAKRASSNHSISVQRDVVQIERRSSRGSQASLEAAARPA